MSRDKCVMKSRTALSGRTARFLLCHRAGFKNKSLHPHLHMPPVLQRSILTIITSYLLWVIAVGSHHLQPLTLTMGSGIKVKV